VCVRDGFVCLSWSSIVGIKRHSKIVDFVFCLKGLLNILLFWRTSDLERWSAPRGLAACLPSLEQIVAHNPRPVQSQPGDTRLEHI